MIACGGGADIGAGRNETGAGAEVVVTDDSGIGVVGRGGSLAKVAALIVVVISAFAVQV